MNERDIVLQLRDLQEITAKCTDAAVCGECPNKERCDAYSNEKLSAIYKSAADVIEKLLAENEAVKS